MILAQGECFQVTAVNGVATFDDLKLDKAGSGYTLTATSGTLTATSGTLTAATNSAFSINPPPTELAFLNQPSIVSPGSAISPADQKMPQPWNLIGTHAQDMIIP